jgi:hypothetical protein
VACSELRPDTVATGQRSASAAPSGSEGDIITSARPVGRADGTPSYVVRSIHCRIRSAIWRLFRSCMIMWLFPRMPRSGGYSISAAPPAALTRGMNAWQSSYAAR